MVSSAALKCSIILAKIQIIFITRGALLVVEDGGRDNTPTSPFTPNFSKTFWRSRYEMPHPAIFAAICCLMGNSTSAGVRRDDQGISCRFLRSVLLTCFLSTSGVSIKAGYWWSTAVFLVVTVCGPLSGHSRLLNLQWPLISNVIETPDQHVFWNVQTGVKDYSS